MAKYAKPLGESGIEWTNRTWNCVTGCDKISPGCKNCYAETLARRLTAMGNPRYTNGFRVTLHADKLVEPLTWRQPEWVFVNSMSDILHAEIPDDFIVAAFLTMGDLAPWHRYQVLTKRPERWASISAQVIDRLGAWPRNILPGTSIENRDVIDGHGKIAPRLKALAKAGDDQTCRMVSVEPLLGSLVPVGGTVADLAAELTEARIGWVITGGESAGPNRVRLADLDWFREVRDACAIAAIPFFHKQHGGGLTKRDKRGGTLAVLDGILHHEMPNVWHAAVGQRGGQLSLTV